MNRIAAALVVVVTLTAASSAFASTDSAGGAGAYLKLGVGARALGQGGAFTAVADDTTAIFWNSAGLQTIGKAEATGMHANLNIDRSYDFLAYSSPLNQNSSWGFAYTRFSIDGIPLTKERTDGSGNPQLTDDLYDGSGNWTGAGPGAGDVRVFGQFDDVEDNFTLSYSRKMRDKINVGANLRILQQKLYDSSATGFGMDLSALYRYSNKLNFGVSVRDLFEKLDFGSGKRTETIPVTATAGVAYKGPKQIRFALDLAKVQNEDVALRVGAEKWFKKQYGLRFGSNDGDFSAGASVKWSEWQFDYAYQTQELGDIQRLSFVKRF